MSKGMAAKPKTIQFLMNIKHFIAQWNGFCLLLGTIFILAKKWIQINVLAMVGDAGKTNGLDSKDNM